MRVILIAVVSFVIQSTYGQSDSFGNWMVRMESGIEVHDKRNPNLIIRENPSHRQADERWGTYHLGMDLQRKIITLDRLGIYGGIGLNYEKATYHRSFNHGHFFDGFVDLMLRFQNRYIKVGTPISINTLIHLNNQLYIISDIRLNWLLYRSISNTNINDALGFPFTGSTFELDEIHMRLGLLCRIGNLSIGLTTRVDNFQKIDGIIFNSSSSVGPRGQRWETYNPLRFDLTAGYTWGRKKTIASPDGQKVNP